MCLSSECDLYCVSTQIFKYPAFTRLDKTKSMRRKLPPTGTAGLARSAVNGQSRFPSPPARTIPRTLGLAMALTLAGTPSFRAWGPPDLPSGFQSSAGRAPVAGEARGSDSATRAGWIDCARAYRDPDP